MLLVTCSILLLLLPVPLLVLLQSLEAAAVTYARMQDYNKAANYLDRLVRPALSHTLSIGLCSVAAGLLRACLHGIPFWWLQATCLGWCCRQCCSACSQLANVCKPHVCSGQLMLLVRSGQS